MERKYKLGKMNDKDQREIVKRRKELMLMVRKKEKMEWR